MEIGLCIKNKDTLTEYFNDLYRWVPEGSHDPSKSVRGVLGTMMKQLYKLSLDNPELDSILDRIRIVRNSQLTVEEWKEQYNQYLLILSKRQEYINCYNRSKKCCYSKLVSLSTLDEDNWNIWGSVRQLKFGKVVVDTLGLNLDPVFGALLSPTGGLVGPNSCELYEGYHQDPLVMHSIVHDAGGYCYLYHKKGPGYNYLRTKYTLFSTRNSLSNQFYGIRYWVKFVPCLDAAIEEERLAQSEESNELSESKE